MCQRSSEELTDLIGSIALISIVLLCFASTGSAQGSDGRNASFRASSSASKLVNRGKTRIAPTTYQRAVRPLKREVPQTGRISIVVNENGSRVYLSNGDEIPNSQPIYTTSYSPSLIVRSLPPGRYTIRVAKGGFFDETRSIDLDAGSRRKIVVSMRPEMALLTFMTNVADAEIEIGGEGRFTKPLKKYLIKPGFYRISVKRRGFLSQTVTADLSIAGREQSIYLVMQPLRIDSVLATANELIEKGDLDTAADLVNDVLQQNPAHAKANLLAGIIEHRRLNK